MSTKQRLTIRSALASIALCALALGAAPHLAHACSCETIPDFPQVRDQSSGISLGVAESIRPAPEAFMSEWVRFAVEESWKGVTTASVEILTAENDGIRGVTIVPLQRYLVFTQTYSPATPYWARLSWLTHPAYANDPVLAALGPPPSIAARPQTWGAVKAAYHR